jgi:hypothetical protein
MKLKNKRCNAKRRSTENDTPQQEEMEQVAIFHNVAILQSVHYNNFSEFLGHWQNQRLLFLALPELQYGLLFCLQIFLYMSQVLPKFQCMLFTVVAKVVLSNSRM